MQQHHDATMNPCDGPNFITEKRRAIDIMSGRYISQMNLSPMLEAEYLKWRKARYDGLAVGRKRDKGWWNDLDSEKHWQQWCNNGTDEIIIVPTPSRSVLEKLYNRLSHEADSPIGSAKRGSFEALAFKSDILFLVN